MANVEHHPGFTRQLNAIKEMEAEDGEELFADVVTLVDALESYDRHLIEGTDHPDDISHPVVSSSLDMWALRRSPPTWLTPEAEGPPYLRIPYVWMRDRATGEDFALVIMIGDKTESENDWYPATVNRIENDIIPRWTAQNPTHEPRKRRRQ